MSQQPPASSDYIMPTTSFWQELIPAGDPKMLQNPPYQYGYPAILPDGRALLLPLRKLPNDTRAVASLIANQASFPVITSLATSMVEIAKAFNPDYIVGLPTLGLAFAPMIAEGLGHQNFIPLGYSRKFWYSEDLSEPVNSITSPDRSKKIFLDPNMLPRLEKKRVLVVDDAISSGSTILSVLKLLSRIDCEVVGILVAMRQGVLWKSKLEKEMPGMSALVKSVIAAPLFERAVEGWVPIAETIDTGVS
ncbi:phosphoribosyltransferase [Sneathiella litorea]|uniref:Phosphoribosyltransferase n=1 Tax=Sneathiella litorea TaxID=2606216 RepID=A0A6L8W7W8_9PROT|nr:phosphoribosyltransferase [Sneathiella litorea]MZR31206.1 phosphoribosyltransferase [Sneathiella litorea]